MHLARDLPEQSNHRIRVLSNGLDALWVVSPTRWPTRVSKPRKRCPNDESGNCCLLRCWRPARSTFADPRPLSLLSRAKTGNSWTGGVSARIGEKVIWRKPTFIRHNVKSYNQGKTWRLQRTLLETTNETRWWSSRGAVTTISVAPCIPLATGMVSLTAWSVSSRFAASLLGSGWRGLLLGSDNPISVVISTLRRETLFAIDSSENFPASEAPSKGRRGWITH